MMKKFIFHTLLFLICLAGLDTAFGAFNRWMERCADTPNYHCCYEAQEDLLILGSSYALKEIVPFLLTDSLQLSCYNAGEAGNGALCAWIRYNMFIRRHTPKIIIYALTPGYDYVDLGKGSDYTEYLKSFKGYHGIEPSVDSMYADIGKEGDNLRMKSAFVRYNSEGINTLYKALQKVSRKQGESGDLHGYVPIYGKFRPYAVPDTAGTAPVKIDEKKFRYLESLLRDATSRGIQVFCVLPPHYYNTYHAQSHQRALALCRELKIPVIDNYNDPFYKNKPYLFGDKEHLNHEGALRYTAQLSDSIKRYYKKQ